MPRPSKHVSPDTLGGRIRAARENLQLSLTKLADGQYSASLISQIERNKIEPSQQSLRFLAERLKLPLGDLETLAQQNREFTGEAQDYKSYDDLRIDAARLLSQKHIHQALQLLRDLYFPQIPATQRWRLAALRGQCYFEKRKFLKAQQDFMYAINERPKVEGMTAEMRLEQLLLHLHMAGTYRELRELDEAREHYICTLQMMNGEIPLGYIAETHWGMARILFEQTSKQRPDDFSDFVDDYDDTDVEHDRGADLCKALEHAETARSLYHSIGDQLQVAAVTCLIAQIVQTQGNVEKARNYLRDILDREMSIWSSLEINKRRQQETANVVSAAACFLAGIELEAKNYSNARNYVNQAILVGQNSFKIRRAEAYSMLGRVLEAIDPDDPAIEVALRKATEELADTHRISSRISAHALLSRHLLRIGKEKESDKELEKVHFLTALVTASRPVLTDDVPPP